VRHRREFSPDDKKRERWMQMSASPEATTETARENNHERRTGTAKRL